MLRAVLAASALALCAAVPSDLTQLEQAPLVQEASSDDGQHAAREPTTFVLFFVPMPHHGQSHHGMSGYSHGLDASCARLARDGKRAVFAGDHSFIYAQQIVSCYSIVQSSPPALNFTYDDLPFKEVAESMPANCSYKFANLSRYDPPTPSNQFKRIARIYLSKIDVLCDAAAALGSEHGQRYALLDAMIGSNENTLPEAGSYLDSTSRLETETLLPGVLRTELYTNILCARVHARVPPLAPEGVLAWRHGQ